MRFLILCFIFISTMASAIPENNECLQSSTRVDACPNLLYKAIDVADVNGNLSSKIICICLTDFTPLFEQPTDETAKVKQKMAITQIEADTGKTAEELRALIRK